MARMTKKTKARTALVEVLAARSAQLAERDANAAVVRGFIKFTKGDFCESVEDGKICFSGNYLTDVGMVSIIPWEISVSDDLVMLSCTLPLRVPESKQDAVALYANRINADKNMVGTLFLGNDKENGGFQYRRDILPSALKSDPNVVLGGHLLYAMDTMAECFTGVLEIIMDATAQDSEEDGDNADANPKESDGGEGPKGKNKGEAKGSMAPTALTPDYSLDGLDIQSEVPLDQIVTAVSRFRKTHRSSEVVPRLSILLSGPSGCGKSEFVKYLGKRAGMEVVVVTASNVLRALVGETEQRIADVFKDAAEKGALLFLDEVDSLLYDRKNAFYGWERVQTNELLLQMERFTGVLVCATNLVEQLDSAVMRRFTFKVQMAALDDEGKVKFFSRYFESELNADERRRLLSIPNLTPGDFRTVRERLYFLSGKNGADNARRIAALEVESAAKKESRAHIGFA